MKYLSLFSGIGGFELGIQQAYESNNEHAHKCKESKQKERSQRGKRSTNINGVQLHSGNRTAPLCIGYSEIDKYAIQVYNKHFNHKNYGDVTKINAKTLPDFELLVGGFPCQSFSIAGKRGGFSDTRGTLFFEIARIVREKQPRLLLLENVKGLLSHDKGATYNTIIATLNELGYDTQRQTLNSKNFGVPQNRERVFIVGHLRGTSRPEVFPIGGSNPKALKQIIGGGQGNRVYSTDGVATTQASQAGGQGAKTGLYAIALHNNRRMATATKNCNSLTSSFRRHPDGDGRPAIAVLTPDRLNKRQNGRRFEENGEPSFTLTGQDKHGIYDGAKIRRLTPKECERLQGFPDDWTKYGKIYKENNLIEPVKISDSQRYKMCGNAVTVNVIKEIVKKLIIC